MGKEKFSHLFKNVFKKSGPDQELKDLLALSAQDPSDMRIKLKIGDLYFKKKDVARGIAVFGEVAEHYTREGFLLKAIAIYKNVIKFSPGSVEFNEKLGELYSQMEMKADAAQQFQIVIHHYQARRQPEEAIRACRKLTAAEPENIQHRLKLAELLFNSGRQEESLQEYERLARDLRREMKDLNTLTEVYEKILLKRPQEIGLLRELCVFYLKLKNPEKAIRKIERFKLEKDEHFKLIYEKALEMKDFLAKQGEG